MTGYKLNSCRRVSSHHPGGVLIEMVTSHVGGDLDGMATYRVFLNCLNETDYLSSVSGDQDNMLILESSSGLGTTTHSTHLGMRLA